MPVCPYAIQSLRDGKVRISYNDRDIFLEKDEVLILVYDRETSPEKLLQRRDVLIRSYPDLVFLEDHVDVREEVAGVEMNNDKYNIIIVQYRDEINQAREILKKTNYYKNWSETELNEMFSI